MSCIWCIPNMCCILKSKVTLLLMIYFVLFILTQSSQFPNLIKQKWPRKEREGRVCVINGTWNAKSKPGAVTVKRKLSVRETAEVIRKSHLKKKIRPWLSSYVTNPKIRNGAQIATKETWGLKMWSIQKDNNSDLLWSSHHTCRLQMRFPIISFLV